jgi:DNA repair protein SbcC/Rad50
VRLQRLHLLNFRQHAATEILFGDGITGIIGPNGAGKTTLLEGLAWAFYGNAAARGNRETIRFNRAPPRSSVRVEVEFALGGHEYRVLRTLYGAELFVDHADAADVNGAIEVTARLQQVLGMEREEFFNTYFTGQKELAVMASLGPADRGRFLSQLLGYERLREAQTRLRETRSALRAELLGLEQGLGDPATLTTELAEAEARAREAEEVLAAAAAERDAALQRREAEGPAWTAMTRLRESMLALDGDRRVAENRVEQARREFGRLDKELAEALAAQTALREMEPRIADVPALRAELAALEAEGRAAGRRRELLGQLEAKRENVSTLDRRLAGLAGAPREVAAAQDALAAARRAQAAQEQASQEARTAWVRDRQDAETKRDQLRAQYKTLQEDRRRIVAAGVDGACPTCTRPLREEYETVLGALDRQLEEIQLNGKFYAQRVEQLAEEPEALATATALLAEARTAVEAATHALAAARGREREAGEAAADAERVRAEVAALEAEVAALPDRYDVARHDGLRDLLAAREPLLQRAAGLRVAAERAEALVRDAEAADQELSARETVLSGLLRRIAELDFSEERYGVARAAYEEALAAVQDAEVTWSTREAELRAARSAMEGVRRRLAAWERQAATAEAVRVELRVHEELDQALGDLRDDLNAQLRPELAELASSFLADLTDGRYHELELDEQYRILLLEDGEPRPVISGGEEDIANLVLRLAISQMVAERAGQPLSLLVLDEIFGSLDERRREHVVALLRRLADRFPQVVLITHIESVRDSVDRALRVSVDPLSGAALVREAPGVTDEDAAA